MNAAHEELFDSSVVLKENEWTQDALQDIPTCKGVLLFIDSQNKPIQIIQAGNLRRAVYTRVLQNEAETSRKTDIAALSRKISWISCHSAFMTQLNYLRLVRIFFANMADTWIQLPTPSFAVIDLDAALPFFYVSNSSAITENRRVYGLFPNRKTALRFTETLNTVFSLCLNPSLLKTSRRSSCPYLQMQKCPGPCLDPSLQDVYLDRVHIAVACANGHFDQTRNELQTRMQKFVNILDFERAQEAKKQLDLLNKLQDANFRWVHNLKDISILHVDQSFKQPIEGKKRKVRHYKWLKIVCDAVYNMGDFLPKSHEDIERFLEQNWTTAPALPYTHNTSEHLGNLAYFLFRSKPAGFWLDCTNGIPADPLFSGLNDCFNICNPQKKDRFAQKKDAENNST